MRRFMVFILLGVPVLLIPLLAQSDVASVGADAIIAENLGSVSELFVLQAHDSPISEIVFSPDGTRMVTQGNEDNFRVWDTSALTSSGAQVIKTIQTGAVLNSIAYNTDGTLLAVGDVNGNVGVWDMSSDVVSPKDLYEGHSDAVVGVAFSPLGSVLYTASRDDRVWYWNTVSAAVSGTLAHAADITSMDRSPNAALLATSSADGVLRVWNIEAKTTRITNFLTGPLYAVKFSPDGRLVAVSDGANNIHVIDISAGSATGIQVALFTGHTTPVTSLAFSPDGGLLVSAEANSGRVHVWDIANETDLLDILGAGAVTFSPDGTLLAIGETDGTVHFWGVAPATPVPSDTSTDTATTAPTETTVQITNTSRPTSSTRVAATRTPRATATVGS